MSVQETKLKAIADAIREKDGTTAPISAADFPARIRALNTGGAPEGTYTITLSSNDETIGEVLGNGIASGGMTVKVKALPKGAGKFVHWEEEGKTVSKTAEYAFQVEKNRALDAIFSTFVLKWSSSAISKKLSGNLVHIAYGGNKFVAISANPSSNVFYSSDGVNWSAPATIPNTSGKALWGAIAYGGGKFVVVSGYRSGSSSNNESAYSTDGINWTKTTLPSSIDWKDIAYSNGKFVAIANQQAAYSSDGITWSSTSLTISYAAAITYGNGKFVVTTYAGGKAAYSTDGITWKSTNLPKTGSWYSVTYGNGKFLTVNRGSTDLAYSNDGVTWELTSLPIKGGRAIAFGDGVFVILPHGAETKESVYSSDEANWAGADLPALKTWGAIAYGNGRFVALSSDSDISAYALTKPNPTSG